VARSRRGVTADRARAFPRAMGRLRGGANEPKNPVASQEPAVAGAGFVFGLAAGSGSGPSGSGSGSDRIAMGAPSDRHREREKTILGVLN